MPAYIQTLFARRWVSSLIAVATVCTLSACSGLQTQAEKAATWSPDKLYSEAQQESASGGYEQAIPLYTALEGRASGTPLAQQAQLEKAYAQYRNGDAADAIATLDNFIRLHPGSPAMDYALYMKGVVHFNGEDKGGMFAFLSQSDLHERDQHAARSAFEAFKELITRYPDSRYVPDARKRMTYIVNVLAASEVSIASYYYRRGAYVAAINRAQSAISTYGATPAQEEALAIMVASYKALGLEQPSDDAQRVLQQNYPQSKHINGYQVRRHSFFKLW